MLSMIVALSPRAGRGKCAVALGGEIAAGVVSV